MLWAYYDGQDLVEEHKFYPSRRWRADFAHVGTKVLVEIEGAVWANGRHTRGSGFIADAEKYNCAALDGWFVFRLAGKEMINRVWIERIRDFIAKRNCADSEG